MKAIGLRTRFLVASALIVVLTIATSYLSAFTFARVNHVVDDSLRENERRALLTAQLTASLEDEDDGLLLSLSGDRARGESEVALERQHIDHVLAALERAGDEPALLATIRADIARYRESGDALLAAHGQAAAHGLYHDQASTLLVRANADVARLGERRAARMESVASWARDETRRATRIATATSVAALLLGISIAFHLARAIVWPIRELTESVHALRDGDFSRRVKRVREDELGQLAEGFNRMAESLDAFRRSNLGQVLVAKQTLEATLAALPDAVLVADASGAIVSANARAQSVLAAWGAPRTIQELPLPDEAHGDIASTRAGEPTRPTEPDLGRAIQVSLGGAPLRLLPRIIPISDAPSARGGVVLVLYDVTELARLDELRLEFVAVASHELRTPLTTLRMTLALLEEAEAFGPRAEETLTTASRACAQLSTTVDELLDLTRIEAGELRLDRERIAVAALVAETVRPLRPRFDDAGVTLRIPDVDRAHFVAGDSARLRVVLSNVLGNALKYTPAAGEVSLGVSRGPHGTVQLVVTDSGVGVPAEFRDRIFDRYFRVEHHRAGLSPVRGVGLGLYLSKRIVSAHGGSIACLGADEGPGTRMVITLPITLEG